MIFNKRKISLIMIILSTILLISWADSFKDLKKSAKKIKSLSSNFIQIKHMQILSRPLKSKGRLMYKIPDSLRWEYSSPIKSILLMRNGSVSRYLKQENSYIKDSGRSLQAMTIIIKEISMWLNGYFDKNPDFITTLKKRKGKVKIILVPRELALKKMINRIEINLSSKIGIIKSIKIIESKYNYTIIKFTNVKINKTLKDSLFEEI